MHRIDYVGISTVDTSAVRECSTAYSVSISPSVKEDHFPVFFDLDPSAIQKDVPIGVPPALSGKTAPILQTGQGQALEKMTRQRVNKSNMNDSSKCAKFRSCMHELNDSIDFQNIKDTRFYAEIDQR